MNKLGRDPPKFQENLANGFGEENENVIVNGWHVTDGTTDDDPSYMYKLSLYTTAELKWVKVTHVQSLPMPYSRT